MAKRRDPIVPANKENPSGQTTRIRRAVKDVDRHLDAVGRWMIEQVKALPVRKVIVNATAYQYQVDLTTLQSIVAELERRLTDDSNRSILEASLAAYRQGIGQSWQNLSGLVDAGTMDLTAVLRSEPVLRRSAILGARVFEEMKGFNVETRTELGRILMQSVEDGINPIEMAREIRERIAMSKRRAETIARTEIIGALRRGRMDEAEETQARLGIKTGMLWVSALSPTSRPNHVARHGKIYSTQEVREFYQSAGEAINCKCAQTEILLNEDGSPISSAVVKRLDTARKAYTKES